MSIRPVKNMYKSTPTMEGAGVRLHRAFGFGKTEDYDPFLLLDDFRNQKVEDYIAGFPWHPHRGIETITYVLAGSVEHKDSLGNTGVLSGGDVQWMTAGSGIIHQEMPQGTADGRMHGFQLWANLPSSLKMTAPRYQDRSASNVPEVTDDDGTVARILCGELWGKHGAVDGIAASPSYFDIAVPPGKTKSIKVPVERNAFAYIFDGDGVFADASEPQEPVTDFMGEEPTADNRTIILFDTGDEIKVRAGEKGIRFLLISGEPIREPVAWYGPIVMNTQEELRIASEEYRNGTFLRHGA